MNNVSSNFVAPRFSLSNPKLSDFIKKSAFRNDMFYTSVQNAPKINKLGDDNLVYKGDQPKPDQFLQTSAFNNFPAKSIQSEQEVARLNYLALYSKFFTKYKNRYANRSTKFFHQDKERSNSKGSNNIKML